jgi:hypothetical protein
MPPRKRASASAASAASVAAAELPASQWTSYLETQLLDMYLCRARFGDAIAVADAVTFVLSLSPSITPEEAGAKLSLLRRQRREALEALEACSSAAAIPASSSAAAVAPASQKRAAAGAADDERKDEKRQRRDDGGSAAAASAGSSSATAAAAASTFASHVSSDVELPHCPSCLETYSADVAERIPRTLPCTHDCCSHCLLEMLQKSNHEGLTGSGGAGMKT